MSFSREWDQLLPREACAESGIAPVQFKMLLNLQFNDSSIDAL